MMRLRDMPVLVVDDNAVNRRILEATLRRWLMKPVLAESGRAGVAAMQEGRLAGTPFPLSCSTVRCRRWTDFSVAEEIRNDPELAGTTVLMLTSAGQRGDGARCRALGIAAYLMKPISQTELLEAILAVLGMPSDRADRLQVVTRHSLRESRRQLRILLAEDNKVNQLVAARLLGKARPHGCHRREWERSAGSPGRARLRRIRSDPDGCADAGDGWSRGHRDHPRAREILWLLISRSSR